MAEHRRYDNCDYDEAYSVSLEKGLLKNGRKRSEEYGVQDPDPAAADYEEQCRQRDEQIREYELERLLKDGKVKCLYRTTTIKTRNEKSGHEMLESFVYPSYRSRHDLPRTKRGRETKPSQRKLNDKNAQRYLTRLINANFDQGDLFVTFTWDDDNMPTGMQGAQKEVSNFFKRVNYRRKKRGYENCRYVYVLAIDDYTRPHVHIVMSGDCMTRDEIEDLWHNCKRKNSRRLAPEDGTWLSGLACYLCQNPHKTKRWQSSKNLIRPGRGTRSYSKFTKKRVDRMVRDYERVREEMQKTYPGYKFIDADIRYNGITAAFYIYARMARD